MNTENSKNTELYYKQIETLKIMLGTKAITEKQYYFSASHMAEKMNMPPETYKLK